MQTKRLIDIKERGLYNIPTRSISIYAKKKDYAKIEKTLSELTAKTLVSGISSVLMMRKEGKDQEKLLFWMDVYQIAVVIIFNNKMYTCWFSPDDLNEFHEIAKYYFDVHFVTFEFSPLSYRDAVETLSTMQTCTINRFKHFLRSFAMSPYVVRPQDKKHWTMTIWWTEKQYSLQIEFVLWDKDNPVPNRKSQLFTVKIVPTEHQLTPDHDIANLIRFMNENQHSLESYDFRTFLASLSTRNFEKIRKILQRFFEQYGESKVPPNILKTTMKQILLRLAIFSVEKKPPTCRVNFYYDPFYRKLTFELYSIHEDMENRVALHTFAISTENDMDLEHTLLHQYTVVLFFPSKEEASNQLYKFDESMSGKKSSLFDVFQSFTDMANTCVAPPTKFAIFICFKESDDAEVPCYITVTYQEPPLSYNMVFRPRLVSLVDVPEYKIRFTDSALNAIHRLKETSLVKYREEEQTILSRIQQQYSDQLLKETQKPSQKDFILPPLETKYQQQGQNQQLQQQQQQPYRQQQITMNAIHYDKGVVRRKKKVGQAQQTHLAFVNNIQSHIQHEIDNYQIAKTLLTAAYKNKAQRILIVDAPNLLFDQFPNDFNGREAYTQSADFKMRLIHMMRGKQADIFYIVSQMNILTSSEPHLTFTVDQPIGKKHFYYSRVACFQDGRNCYELFGQNECDDYVRNDTKRRLWKLQEQVRAVIDEKMRAHYGITAEIDQQLISNRFNVLRPELKQQMRRELKNMEEYPIITEITNDRSRNWVRV